MFCGDQLLVELGPPERPSDDPRVPRRLGGFCPYLPLHKNHNWLGAGGQPNAYI